MIVKRATKEDLHQLAVLFDEYRQFYGTSSNIEQSYQFLNIVSKIKIVSFSFTLKMMCHGLWFTVFVFHLFPETYYILDDVYVTPSLSKTRISKAIN